MLWTICISRQEREIDFVLVCARELFLCLFSFVLEALQSGIVVLEVDTFLFLEYVEEMVNDTVVEVLTTKVCISVGRLHLKDAIAKFEDGNVKRTATEIKDSDLFLFTLFEAIGERRSGWLVDDTLDLKSSNLSSVLGSLAL